MDGFFIIVLLFILWPVIAKFLRQASKTANDLSAKDSKSRNVTSNARWDTAEFKALKDTLQGLSTSSETSSRSNDAAQRQRKKDYEARRKRMGMEAAKRTRRLKAHDASHGDTVERRDINDKNPRRRADWGARAGPGILNTKTVLTIVVMGVILAYIMAST